MAELYTFVVKDASEHRDDGLRTLRAGLISRGVTSPNVTPGSDYYVEFQAIGNELEVISANAVVKADQSMEDTASGDFLEGHAARYGLAKRPAEGSTGTVILDASAASLVSSGQQLIGPQGLVYQVTVGGTYSDSQAIPIEAVDVGASTNLDEGTSLKWQTAPAYSKATALVGDGGLVNGTDAEDDEELRQRVLARLQNPPQGGNWQQVAEFGEDSTPSVQKAFVYPAIQGPATVHVAVTARPTAHNKSRQIATATMTGTVVPYVQGQLTEREYSVVTTVADVNAYVAIGLSLPAAPTASPPGPGGGWKDGSPWPSVDGTTYFKVSVTAVTSTTQFTVDAQTAPTVNVSRIAWLRPAIDGSDLDWTLYQATVTAYSGTAGAYVITIDTPFVGIAVDQFIWPQCENQELYVAAILAGFRLMGPGEKTSNASALIRGFRHPQPFVAWPYAVNAFLCRAITDSAPEVLAAEFFYRSDADGQSLNGSASVLTPGIPASVEDPPKCYVPSRVAFYPIT